MSSSSWFGAMLDFDLRVAWEDGERVFYRNQRNHADEPAVLAVLPRSEHPTPLVLERFAHEYALKDQLNSAWAVRPLQLLREHGHVMLVLEDSGGRPLQELLGAPMKIGKFLSLAINIATTLAKAHQQGLVHKDINPANILVDELHGEVRLCGFGMASRLLRERQSLMPEIIAGTLAYMAPEQTGRTSRSIDSRTDLYALGVTLYRMLTGSLPFSAADPIEWVHCHVAKQPVPPREKLKTIPLPVSSIVVKLLAKNAEERYQTAAGLESDLRRCLVEWEARGRIDNFPLGERDTPDRLVVPEKLYGRTSEVAALFAAFDRIVKGGRAELVLVSGYPGVGKSTVVNELQKLLAPSRALFAAGKFGQYERDIPYATLAKAFRRLIRPLLGQPDAGLHVWRDAFAEALGINGQLVVDLVPELKLIIGEQPGIADLSPQEARQRFQGVLRRFFGAFARSEHPLVLFLDDLQWVDTATLDVLESLLTTSDVHNLLLIGAYRSNEVGHAHPLMRKLEGIRNAGAIISEIQLAPLTQKDLRRLVADALRCEPGEAATLAQLIYNRTLGNPFFVIQLLTQLAEEQLIQPNGHGGAWHWDLDRIRAKPHSDNVVDFMVAKLKRLPAGTLELLKLLACLGSLAQRRMLQIAYDGSPEKLEKALLESMQADLIMRVDGSFKFLHDRIQEAAYSLIEKSQRAAAHVRIGRKLLARLTQDEISEQLFDIVNQLNSGVSIPIPDGPDRATAGYDGNVSLFTDPDERLRIAALNLRAARRAKASTAYAAARVHLTAGITLLGSVGWEKEYELAFGLHLERAECEFLSGNPEAAEELIADLLGRAASNADRAAVYRLKIVFHVVKSEYWRAVESALHGLRLFGIEISPHPSDDEVKTAYEEVWHNLAGRSIESLIDLPLMNNVDMLAAVAILSDLSAPAHVTDVNLMRLNTCYLVNLTLKFGTTSASTFGFAWFGVLLGPVFHRYGEGYRFGQVAVRLVQKHGFLAHKAKSLLAKSLLGFWSQNMTTAVDLTGRAFQAALAAGDYTFACYSHNYRIEALLVRGDNLDEVWQETEAALAFVLKLSFRDAADIIVSQQRLIENMRGRTVQFSTFSGAQFDEAAFEAQLTPDRMATMICWYWVLKLQARFMSGDYEAALTAAERARTLLWSSDAQIHVAEYHFYRALAIAAACTAAGEPRRDGLLASLKAHLMPLREWADNCSAIFLERHALAAAELARLEHRELDAERLYEDAIGLSREHGFIQDEGLGNELAARFYSSRGFETTAQAYLRNARYCYLRWGALGKVKQLDQLHPLLAEREPLPVGSGSIGAPLEYLDLASVIKLSQALSSEIVFEKLIQQLMTIAVEHAGADRGLLILCAGDDARIEAEAKILRDGIEVCLIRTAATGSELPFTMLQYVLRTQESLVLNDALVHNEFSSDGYFASNRCRSVFCLPLVRQARLIGVLYLENSLTPGVFSPARAELLKVLASQAAISLENSHLYRELAEREGRIRRLVEANIIGIVIFDFEGRIIEANDTFLRMLGFERDDFVSGRVLWTDLIPPEWRDRAAQGLRDVKLTGTTQPFERDYLRKDGSRVPVLIGAASFEDGGNQGVAFVLDLTERKRAEELFLQMQTELAHANRVATMGQFTASIAHEISQPLTAVDTNASAALRWLARDPPDLENTRDSLEQIIADAGRAGNIITGIRNLVKKSTPRKESFDINEAIREIGDLTRGEATKNGIVLQTRLAESLPLIHGDRVQLQQVILNLVVNAIEALREDKEGQRELVISTGEFDPGVVTMAVQDSGPGIKPSDTEKIFDAFYTTKPTGLGMGLSICRSIIQAHGGRLWVVKAKPRGTIFQFSIPIARGDAERTNLSSPTDMVLTQKRQSSS